MTSPKQDKVFTIRLTKKLRQKLEKKASRIGATPSQVVRKLLTDKLKNIK